MGEAGLLALKLVVVPLLVGGSALAARAWGPAIGGWLIALPLTSGPTLLFLSLDHGPSFAAHAAVGSLSGVAAISCFGLAYLAVAGRGSGPAVSLGAGAAAFFGVGALLSPLVGAPPVAMGVVTLATIAVADRRIVRSGRVHERAVHPRWDLPARIVLATALVVGITTVAPRLGPGLSGLLATYPVYLSVLVVFTHRHAGPAAVADAFAGFQAGAYGTGAFYLVLIALLASVGIAVAFGAAVAVTVALQAIGLRRTRLTGAAAPGDR